jgi:hypothetical protein
MPLSVFSRYAGLDTVVLDGVASLTQRPQPALVTFPDALVHEIIGGETLDQLAKLYYGREDLWWRIADANPGMLPVDWSAGDKLTIPPLRVATKTTIR